MSFASQAAVGTRVEGFDDALPLDGGAALSPERARRSPTLFSHGPLGSHRGARHCQNKARTFPRARFATSLRRPRTAVGPSTVRSECGRRGRGGRRCARRGTARGGRDSCRLNRPEPAASARCRPDSRCGRPRPGSWTARCCTHSPWLRNRQDAERSLRERWAGRVDRVALRVPGVAAGGAGRSPRSEGDALRMDGRGLRSTCLADP